MLWLTAAIALAALLFLLVAWRIWIAPWREVERLVRQIGRGERPSTFLVGGGENAHRVALELENVSNRNRELDREIAKRESGTQTIFSAMHDGLLVVDSERRVVLANETFRRLFAVARISPGEPLLEIVREPTVDKLIIDTLAAGQKIRAELTAGDSSGSPPRYFELNGVATRNDAGKITGAVVLFHDITELKRVAQIRSDFVANVSHELRTPLSILRGYIETLLDDPDSSREEVANALTVMHRHSQRLGSLVADLLTLAQLESVNPNLQWSKVDLGELFTRVSRDWEKKFAKKKLKLIVDVAPNLSRVPADEARLEEVLYNLLDNAVKYSSESGEVRLQAEQRDSEIIIAVGDNGIGIAQEDISRIFERFYRADKARSRALGGTGLGLSIVKHIAQLHGGRVEAESEVGKGTTVRVILPIKNDEAA
jgi:two-component system phosphate regulon sensor histidine kinase PhoR